ncbi:alpha/beta fold hydrolase [Candidatus Woesearchaeota archaeon]|nr:alpha/beta fold hydrolase [Candidatus Woesearchaeota archaeon]
MIKRVIIIHGWGATPESDWFPFLKKELLKKGYEVEVPEMPNTDEPNISEWVSELDKLKPDEFTILVGHSVGCRTILNYLKNNNIKVKKVILVAPWLNINLEVLDNEEKEIVKPWINDYLVLDDLRKKSSFVVVHSLNDPFSFKEDIEELLISLNAEEVNLGNKGHINAEDGKIDLPEILKFF